MELLREKLLKAAQNDEDRLLLSRIADTINLAQKHGMVRFTPFLGTRIQEAVFAILKKSGTLFSSFGGYEGAERQMLCFGAYEGEEPVYPIVPLEITGRDIDNIGHRDILGAIMSLGIKRETVGDIFRTGNFMIMAESSIATYLTMELCRVGKYAVDCKEYTGGAIAPPERQFKEIRGTVASVRLDSVVALMAGVSRSEAVALVSGGRVILNGLPDTHPSRTLSDGDKISARGFGKAELKIFGQSKKGRQHITLLKYN